MLRDHSGSENISQVLAVHAALLHTGHILYFGGDEHDPGINVQGKTNPSVLHTARLFDCTTNQILNVDQLNTDVFCCGHALLQDGSLLVAGGTDSYNQTEEDEATHKKEAKVDKDDKVVVNPHSHFTGLPNAFRFDPEARRWHSVPDMLRRPMDPKESSGGRWYPTLITLPNGDVLAMSGHRHKSSGIRSPDGRLIHEPADNIPQIYDPVTNRWTRQDELGGVNQEYYPRLHVLRAGSTSSNFLFTSTYLNQPNRAGPITIVMFSILMTPDK